MKISLKKEYIILISFSLLFPAGIFFIDYIRIIVALPFILLLPGYLLTALLYPRADDLKKLERVVLSLGLSILTVPWMGFLQNHLLEGIRLLPMMLAITFLNFILIGLSWYRRKSLPEDERFKLTQNVDLLKWKEEFKKKKWFYSVYVITGLLLIGTIAYVFFSPGIGDNYTEFYITGKDGKAANYPEQLEVGEYGEVNAVIINHEHQKVIYNIEIRVDGDLIRTIPNISLENLEKWDETVNFKATKPDMAVKVDFLLFKDTQDSTPYRQLNLWVKVIPGEEGGK